MGQTLSAPITDTETSSLENEKLKVGSSCMQGWRVSMEDAHVHILNLNEDSNSAFFGVYDGHGGATIAQRVSNILHKIVLNRPEYKSKNYAEAIANGFLECDSSMRHDEALKDEMSGSTGITALLRNDTDLYVGNVGDSRCIASVDGVAEALSVDHKPTDPIEKERIENAGGYVEYSRVNGNLALSRAFGDFNFKNRSDLSAEAQVVSAYPDVVQKTVQKNWDFVVLACDGIWDVLSNQEVADFITRRIGDNLEPDVICEELMTRCLATDCAMGGLGCDNMTVIIVCFLHNQPYSKLVEKCAKIIKIKDEQRQAEVQEIENAEISNEKSSENVKTPASLPASESATNGDDDERRDVEISYAETN